MTGKKIKEKVKLILLNIGFILLSFLTLIPILYAFSISISGSNSIISTEFHILPKTITMDNYITILTERPFGRWFVNSLLLSALTVLLTMLVAVPAAYVFSRMRFARRKRTLYILLVLNAFPAILSMFAIYRIIKTLNLLNSYMGLVFIYAGSMAIFVFWNMKGYFDTIPVEIAEAAMIDGCNPLQTFFGVVMPILKPTAITVAILNAMWIWNDYLLPYLVIGLSTNYKTIPVVVQYLVGSYGAKDLGAMMALLVLSVIPIIVFYLTCQKYIIEGVVAGAVKG